MIGMKGKHVLSGIAIAVEVARFGRVKEGVSGLVLELTLVLVLASVPVLALVHLEQRRAYEAEV